MNSTNSGNNNTKISQATKDFDVLMCECVETVNEQLATRNTRLSQAIVFGGKRKDNLMLQTEQIEKGRGKPKAVTMFLSYCPFCGVKYEDGVSQ